MNEQTDIERRVFTVELRDAQDVGELSTIAGYAAKFNSYSELMFGFREIIEPGFFDDVLGDDVRALFNHDRNYVLGRSSNGTLQMAQDATGLKVDIAPPDTKLIDDLVLEPMRRGDVDQMSFAFTLKPGGDDWRDEDGQLVRVLKKGGALRLYDVSVVTEPAYPETSAQVRAKIQEFQQAEHPVDVSPGDQAGSGGPEARHALRRRRLQIVAQEKRKQGV